MLQTNASSLDSLLTLSDIKQKSTHHSFTSCNVKIVTTTDIVPPTASERQNAEIVHQRSTRQRNVRAKNIVVVDAKAHTLPGHRIARIEMQKEGD